MKWGRRLLLVLGWGLVLTAGWLKGGDEGDPEVLLGLLIAGGVIVAVATTRGRD